MTLTVGAAEMSISTPKSVRPVPPSGQSTFPSDFVWGTATSAYQIEGACREDGRGSSIWDRYCKKKGNIERGENAEIACDHYHRWREDLGLLRQLGTGAYRFSISWPRL